MASKAKSENTPANTDTTGLPATNNTASVPAFMAGEKDSGKEGIDRGDMITPRIALMQAVNPEVTDGRAVSGNFFHSVAEIDLGEKLRVVLVYMSKRYILWRPRHEGGGVLARASDGLNWDIPGLEFEIAPYKDMPKKKVKLAIGNKVGRDIGLGKWGSLDPENPDSPPAATLSYNFVVRLLDYPELGPCVLSLQRSAEPVAKMLLSKVQVDPAPMYGQVFEMGSKAVSQNGNDFNQYTFTKAGHVQDEATYLQMKKDHEFFSAEGVKYDEAADQPSEDVTANGVRDTGAHDPKAKY